MSRGLAATRHLFGGHCIVGARRAAELTRANNDLTSAARGLSRNPDSARLHAVATRAKAKRDSALVEAEQHIADCQTCADHGGDS